MHLKVFLTACLIKVEDKSPVERERALILPLAYTFCPPQHCGQIELRKLCDCTHSSAITIYLRTPPFALGGSGRHVQSATTAVNMRLQAIIGFLLAASVTAQSWHGEVSRSQASDVGRQFQGSAIEAERSNVRCFGLARRTRTQTIQKPHLYNVRTGQTAPVPAFLFSAENWVINKMENEGWEVRTRTMNVPKHIYERVPICCPWDNQCNHGRQPQTVASPAGPGPCANGGQLIYRDGQRKCECSPGFGGPWCQISEGAGALTAGHPFPTGPLTRVRVTQGPFSEMVREAELWRRKVLQNRQGGQFSQGGAPMLSPRDHLLASVAGPWAQQAAMWHHDTLRSKMTQAMTQAQMVRAQMAQAAQEHFGRGHGQWQPNDMTPFHVMRAMQQRGGNPYSAVDPRAMMAMAKQSAFQTGAMRGYLTELARQEMQRQHLMQQQQQQQGINPYGRHHLDLNDPNIQALLRMHNLQPTGGNPYAAMPPPPMTRPGMANNPYDRTRPFGRQPDAVNAGMRPPQARTPWDLDPFGNQVPPFMRGDPRRVSPKERQMIAMAMYQHLMAHHRPEATQNQPPPGYPERMMPPLIKEFQPEVPMSFGNEQTQQNQEGQSWTATKPEEDSVTAAIPQGSVDLGIETSGPRSEMGVGDTMPSQLPPVTNVPNMDNRNMQPMTGDPAMGMGPQPPMADQPEMMMPPHPPTAEEIQQMQECQQILTPRIDECLQSHQMTLENFMNPEYMPKAREVCEDSVSVGQCITKLDDACGQTEVMAVTVTRKMLASVLQMMTMVCRQIEARGDAQIPPVQTQHGGPDDQMGAEREPMIDPREENVPGPARDDLPAFLGPEAIQDEAETETVTDPTEPSKTESVEQNSKLDNKDNQVTEPTRHDSAASQSGHDHAHPVAAEAKMFGLPLWLVVFVGVVSPLVLVLVALIACLCVRRSKRKKVDIEIEKIPAPLDGKLYTVGIPPPSYTTAAISQTHDGLNLPPLDLVEDSVVVPVEDEEDKKMMRMMRAMRKRQRRAARRRSMPLTRRARSERACDAVHYREQEEEEDKWCFFSANI
ncbi:hypothetical protein RRG08_034590 [Elysia crispata]|uniref:EGF-like domain-containing protein n=1 Tax=Elysia crispata TaxID=231223 RepID=A0AAE1E896_9GAST|nr:hypothetical protein RRG08_034590 [Elysia crispata]